MTHKTPFFFHGLQNEAKQEAIEKLPDITGDFTARPETVIEFFERLWRENHKGENPHDL